MTLQSNNPFRPGAGTLPTILAGRDQKISDTKKSIDNVIKGLPQRPIAFYGLRGVGKTVLLNVIEEYASTKGVIADHVEISENDNFKKVIAQRLRKILFKISKTSAIKGKILDAFQTLKSFTVSIPELASINLDFDSNTGYADSGNFQSDLTDLMISLGEAAKQENKVICFLIDELQYLKPDDFEAIIAASHRISQKALPIQFICAGLPQLLARAADAKSYAERQFLFSEVDVLDSPEDKKAIYEPFKMVGIKIEDDAIQKIIKETNGYPYFIQEYGSIIFEKYVSEKSINNTQDLDARFVEKYLDDFYKMLDLGFYKSRWDRATETERKYMRCMASLGEGPYKSADVAALMKRKPESMGPLRAGLINKGFIFSPEHSKISFTVPGFEKYLKRNNEI